MLSRPLAILRQHGLRKPHHFRPSSTSTAQSQSRISRLESRLPPFLRRYTTPLRSAPVSHITAFLLLHEITAVVPLLGLTAAFHYFDWLPSWFAEGELVKEGVEKFGRYARRKGWIDDEERGRLATGAEGGGNAAGWWGVGEGGVRLVVELATAWAVTKVLLPVRLVLSVWATPWFAKWSVLPVMRVFGKLGGSRGVGNGKLLSEAAGTNAVAGGAVPRNIGNVK